MKSNGHGDLSFEYTYIYIFYLLEKEIVFPLQPINFVRE